MNKKITLSKKTIDLFDEVNAISIEGNDYDLEDGDTVEVRCADGTYPSFLCTASESSDGFILERV